MKTAFLLLAVAAGALAGCGPAHPPSPPAGSSIRLSATLDDPTDVTLRWSGVDPHAAGSAVEFTSDPPGEFAVLQFVPPEQTTFDHRDLMPQTGFCYRLRPYFGPASTIVDVALPPGDFDENAHAKDPDWAAPRAASGAAQRTSIRQPGRPTAGAPTGLRAGIADPNGIVFTWADHATDEEGFLLEAAPAGRPFRVVAVLDPNVTRFGLVTLPEEKHAAYRVRAHYYGASSPLATIHTGG